MQTRSLLADIGVPPYSPTFMYCNSKSAIQILYNSVFYERMKHIEIDYHLIRYHQQTDTISLPFIFLIVVAC